MKWYDLENSLFIEGAGLRLDVLHIKGWGAEFEGRYRLVKRIGRLLTSDGRERDTIQVERVIFCRTKKGYLPVVGEGVERIKCIPHLSVPWRPSDWDQYPLWQANEEVRRR